MAKQNEAENTTYCRHVGLILSEISSQTHSLTAKMNTTSVTMTDNLWKSTVDGLA